MTNKGRLLLVDDNTEHRLLCKLIFTVRGFELKSLPHCDELFKMLESYEPELILMDYELPGMNGAEAITLLKQRAKFKMIPVLFFSGDDKLAQLAIQVSAEDYLPKPFKVADLMQKVGQLLKRRLPDH